MQNKTAAEEHERGFFNKVREETNFSGKLLEKLNPEFREWMSKLRKTDEWIRSQASSIKEDVLSSKSSFKSSDYLLAANQLSDFHESARSIAFALDKFKDGVNLEHYKFLLDQMDSTNKEKLFNYNPEGNPRTASYIKKTLIKNSGLMEWFSDNTRDNQANRGKAMKALEKRFSVGFLRNLRNGTEELITISENFYKYLISIFKKLGTALATRNIQNYIDHSNEFINKFALYHKSFVEFHKANITPLKKQYEALQEQARQKEEDEAKKVPPFPAQISESPAAQVSQSPSQPSREDLFARIPKSPMHPDMVDELGPTMNINKQNQPNVNRPTPQEQIDVLNKLKPADETEVDLTSPFNLVNKKSHQDFITVITKLAETNQPKKLVDQILSYSEFLEEENPDESLKLLAVAEGLVEDLKIVNGSKSYEAGIRDGKHDLENYGFGSDVVASLCALKEDHKIPPNEKDWMEYLNGYVSGSNMPSKQVPQEKKKIMMYLNKDPKSCEIQDEKRHKKEAGIFDRFKKNPTEMPAFDQSQNKPEPTKPAGAPKLPLV